MRTAPYVLPEPDGNWVQRGICRYEDDPDLWFPIGESGPSLLQIEEAKAVCRRCPAMRECGEWAVDNAVPHGVWGGLSETDRKLVRARRAKARHLAKKAAEKEVAV